MSVAQKCVSSLKVEHFLLMLSFCILIVMAVFAEQQEFNSVLTVPSESPN